MYSTIDQMQPFTTDFYEIDQATIQYIQEIIQTLTKSLTSISRIWLITCIISFIITITLITLGIINLIRCYKVLGEIHNYFDELSAHDLSPAKIAYYNAVNLHSIAKHVSGNDVNEQEDLI